MASNRAKRRTPTKTTQKITSTLLTPCCCLQVLVYGDCAVNTDPNPEQLAKIGITSAETAAAFGIEPRVAFLSYSTFGSGAGPDVEKASPLLSSFQTQLTAYRARLASYTSQDTCPKDLAIKAELQDNVSKWSRWTIWGAS